VRAEIVLTANLLAFVVLWKTKKFREALKYIKVCTKAVNDLNRSFPTIFSDKTRLNLIGLIAMSFSSSIATIESDPSQGFEIINECLSQFAHFDIEVKPLMYRLLDKLGDCEEKPEEEGESLGDLREGLGTPDWDIPGLPREYLEKKELFGEQRDLLITKEFETLLFITAFLSHIDPSTPLIRETELELAATRHYSVFLPQEKSKSPSKLPSVPQDLPSLQAKGYYHLFKRITVKQPLKGDFDTSRPHATLPDWEENKHRAGSTHQRADSALYSDSVSEVRDRSVPSRGRMVYYSPTLVPTRIAPNLSVLHDLERSKRSMARARNYLETMQQEAESRLRTKRNLMVEFAPKGTAAEVLISLQPLPSAPRQSRLPRLQGQL